MIPEIALALARAFHSTPRLGGAEWPCENVYLTTGATQGPFSWASNPAMEEVQAATTQRGVTQVTVMGSPQTTGKTTFLSNLCMERGHQRPRPMLYVSSKKAKATEWAINELKPRLLACEALKEQLPPPNRHRYDLASKAFRLRDFWVAFAGGQTDTDIKSMSVATLMMDEVDAWIKYGGNRSKGKSKSATESPFHILAKERVSSYRITGDALVAVVSTPSVEEGPIYQEFLAGTQETYRPCCPKCDRIFPRRVTIADYALTAGERPIPRGRKDRKRGLADWDVNALRKGACIVCPRDKCGGRIGNHERGYALSKGRAQWVAENPQVDPDHRSFHVSRHVGRAESMTPVGDVAVAYITAMFTAGGMHHFSNASEAWPYVMAAANRDAGEVDKIIEFSPSYQLVPLMGGLKRKLPPGCIPVVILAGMDVQARGVVYTVRAIDINGASWLIDAAYETGGGDVTHVAGRLLETRWHDEAGAEWGIYEMWCDAGYRASMSGSVYEAHAAFPDTFFPVAGRDRTNHRMVSDINIQTQLDSKTQQQVSVYWIDDDLFKRRLYHSQIAAAGNDSWKGWYLPTDIDDAAPVYRMHILSERMHKDGWEKKGPNDFGDAEKYTLALATHLADKIQQWISDYHNPDGDGAAVV